MQPSKFVISHNKFFLDRLYDLRINIATNGDFIDNETLKTLYPNHLKILLKHEYKNKYKEADKLEGKNLERFINYFLNTAVQAINILRTNPNEAQRFKKFDISQSNGFI